MNSLIQFTTLIIFFDIQLRSISGLKTFTVLTGNPLRDRLGTSLLPQKNPRHVERKLHEHKMKNMDNDPVPRRDIGSHIFGGMSALMLIGTPGVIQNSHASAATNSAFVGTYSDPINHPGGKRTIRLLDKTVGDYQLAEVDGGGGVGEPKSYVLPAVIIGDRAIVIDFSPKGGPRDFTGVLEGNSIKFLKDGNKWPRID